MKARNGILTAPYMRRIVRDMTRASLMELSPFAASSMPLKSSSSPSSNKHTTECLSTMGCGLGHVGVHFSAMVAVMGLAGSTFARPERRKDTNKWAAAPRASASAKPPLLRCA